MARTTRSSLKDHRSSSEPPPRTSSRVSTSRRAAGQAQRRHQRCRGIGALHRARVDDHPHLRRAPRQRGQHVVQCRRGEGGDDAERRRPGGNGPLARGVEQPGRLEPRLQAQELLVQRAGPKTLHRLDHQLQLAARLVDHDAPAHLDLLAVLGLEVQQRGGAPEHRAAQQRLAPAMSFNAK